MRNLLLAILLLIPNLCWADKTLQIYSTDIRPATDQLLDVGTPTYRWKNGYFGGNIGINSTNPIYRVDVVGTVQATTFLGTIGTASQTNITSVGTLGSLNVSGNVGIGTTALNQTLTVNGNVGIGSTNALHKLDVTGTSYFNGNIGIGSTLPSASLDIRNGHLVSSQDTLPTVSSCGTGSPAITAGSSDNSGEVTWGTGTPTSCVVTFAIPFRLKPHCVIQEEAGSPVRTYSYTATTGAITISASAQAAGAVTDWICIGN